jgi:hypothetical protein
MMRIRSVFSAVLCIVASMAVDLGLSAKVYAADFDYRASLGAGHSDNIRRAEVNEQDEDIVGPEFQFSLDQHGRQLHADVIGKLGYYEYLNDTYDSEVLGNLIADTRYDFIQDRLSWMLTDNFGQVLGDAFSPATPDNRENINHFSTGPDWTLPLGAQNRFRVGARYGMTNYEDSPFDSVAVSAEAAFIRSLSTSSSISLNANAQDVEYDEAALNSDYTQTELFMRYSALGARTQIDADVGYTEVDRDAVAETEDGVLLRLVATRRLSSASTLRLRVGKEFTSSGGNFAESQSAAGSQAGTLPGRQTTQPFTRDYARVDYSFRRNRFGAGVYGSWNEQTYEDNAILDQTIRVAGGLISREMSRTTSLELILSYADAQFGEPNTDYHQIDADLGFSWRLSSTLSLRASYLYSDRTSDVLLGDYTENRIWLSLGYGRGIPRTGVAGPAFAVDSATGR